MEDNFDIFLGDNTWQATCRSLLMNLRDENLVAIQAPKIRNQRLPKKFTKEAIYTIHVMFAFILLAISGTLITTYEFLHKTNGKKTHSRRNKPIQDKEKRMKKIKNGKQSLKIYYNTWLKEFKCFLKCFCMLKNGSKILSIDSCENQIDCIQGLRFVFSTWIIFGHTFQVYASALKDVTESKPLLELKSSQLLLNFFFAVDIFFVISGFLNAYNFFQNYTKFNGNISWFNFYYKRFMRLTPVYMIVLGFYTTLFTRMGNGIMWPSYDTNPVCKKDWWWYLFYINNFEESIKECMVWCWYLAADMQFYVISPLLLIPLKRWPRFGYALVFTCISGSCVIPFILTYKYNLTDGFSRFEFYLSDPKNFMIKFWEYYEVLYTKPYMRIGQYSIGLILGYYLQNKTFNKKIIKNSKITLFCGWSVTAVFMWICFFSLHQRKEIMFETALYNGTKFLFSSCSYAWIIYVCVTRQAEFLNACLSSKILLPLGRLSYCVYLIHPIILIKQLLDTEELLDCNLKLLVEWFFSVCAYTYIISFAVSIFFEMPVLSVLARFCKKSDTKISHETLSEYHTNFENISDLYKIS